MATSVTNITTNTSIFTVDPTDNNNNNTPANIAARVNANATLDPTDAQNENVTPVDRAVALRQQGESVEQIAIALGLNVTLVSQLLGLPTATNGNANTTINSTSTPGTAAV